MLKSQDIGSKRADMPEEQLEAAVINVTSYLLSDMRNMRKHRKEDVVTNALDKSSKQYAVIMKRAKEHLSNIFGLTLAHVPNSEDAFIIMNKHGERFNELMLESCSEEDIQNNLILTAVLAAIFMNRGSMFENHVMTFLETAGFLHTNFFGEHRKKDHVTKLVKNTFVKQMYLGTESTARPDQVQNPPLPETERKVTVFHWGFRALLEVDIDQIVEYLKKIHGGKQPVAFPVVYYNQFKASQGKLRAQVL